MNKPMRSIETDAGEPTTHRRKLAVLAAKPCECERIKSPPCDACWAKERLQAKGERKCTSG